MPPLGELFGFGVHPLEIVLRGSATYWFLFLLFLLLPRNLRREHITTEELMASLREQGIDKLADVKTARMEGDGRISVIRTDGAAAQAQKVSRLF